MDNVASQMSFDWEAPGCYVFLWRDMVSSSAPGVVKGLETLR